MVTIARVLVPLDFSESSSRSLEYARALAERFDASLDLLHIVPNPYLTMSIEMQAPLPQAFLDDLEREAKRCLDDMVGPAERSRFDVRRTVKVGDPLSAIVDYAGVNHADLIVMGTHGRTGVARFVLGSVAERVVRTATCPVLTIR